MKKQISVLSLALTVAASLTSFAITAKAQTTTQTFGTGGNQFSLDFQTIGNVGNKPDTTGYGAVGYTYGIGTYTISQNQVNAAIANGAIGIDASSTGNTWAGEQPATGMTWFQAAAFVNWLDTSSGYSPAYNLSYNGSSYTMSLWNPGQSGYNSSNPYRNSGAMYVLPSEQEWYKAAYYDPAGNGGTGSYNLYPTGNSVPTAVASGTATNTAVYNQPIYQGPASVHQAGGLSAYGTMGQGGNVWQWEESPSIGTGGNNDPNAVRAIRGGGWYSKYYGSNGLQSSFRYINFPNDEYNSLGFRVAELSAVPEPSTYALCLLAGVIVLVAYRRRRVSRLS